jgi:hypothetical protein
MTRMTREEFTALPPAEQTRRLKAWVARVATPEQKAAIRTALRAHVARMAALANGDALAEAMALPIEKRMAVAQGLLELGRSLSPPLGSELDYRQQTPIGRNAMPLRRGAVF